MTRRTRLTAPLVLVLSACAPPHVATESSEVAVQGCKLGFDDPALSAAISAALASTDEWGQVASAHGVVVGVASPSMGMRVQAFGAADAYGTPMDEAAVFGLGSIQKNLRFTLLHHLAEDDVDMSDVITDVLPSASASASAPTMPTYEGLTMHKTGLKRWGETPSFLLDAFSAIGAEQTPEYAYADMIQYLTEGGTSSPLSPSPHHARGISYWYTDYAPLLAGEKITVATGEHVHDVTQRKVLDRFAMKRTTLQGFSRRPEALARGHWADGSEHRWQAEDVNTEIALSSAAGGLYYSSACDLLRYGAGIFSDESFLSPATIEHIRATSVTAYAYPQSGPVAHGDAHPGFYRPLYLDEGYLGHFGAGQHGHSSVFMHRLDDGTTFVVLANVAADGSVRKPGELGVPDAETGPGDGFVTQRAVLRALDEAL